MIVMKLKPRQKKTPLKKFLFLGGYSVKTAFVIYMYDLNITVYATDIQEAEEKFKDIDKPENYHCNGVVSEV